MALFTCSKALSLTEMPKTELRAAKFTSAACADGTISVRDFIIVFAVTSKEAGKLKHTAFVLPMTTPGVTLAPHDEKMGIHAAQSCADLPAPTTITRLPDNP